MIRKAEERDADDLARIYNQAVKPGSFATSDLEPVSRANRLQWLSRHQPPFGAWVYESADNRVVGWCSLNQFSVRPYYPAIAEISVYVDENYRFRILGPRLLQHLIDEARKARFRSLVTVTFEKNVSSIAGCVALGDFKPMAMLYEVALMGSGWENVVWLQRDLSPDQ